MPELPEVETTRRALVRLVVGRRLERVVVGDRRLREPVPGPAAWRRVEGARLLDIERRAKYLLWRFEGGTSLLVHLGMSGRILRAQGGVALDRHDHVRWFFDGDEELRLRDPRRFGLVTLVADRQIAAHPRLRELGVEPLGEGFDGARCFALTRGVRRPVKNLLMDSHFVVGIGNIYASESLHRAGIHPQRAAGAIAEARWRALVSAVRETLGEAIEQGGTTLRDFAGVDGELGYFAVRLRVYGRDGEPCPRCGRSIRREVQAGRATFYCPGCQH